MKLIPTMNGQIRGVKLVMTSWSGQLTRPGAADSYQGTKTLTVAITGKSRGRRDVGQIRVEGLLH